MEWGWPLGLKVASLPGRFRVTAGAIAVICILLSGGFLYLAQRSLPVGTAYAVWTGIGSLGTFLLGILLLGEPAHASRFLYVGLIILGVIGLRFSAPS